MPDSEPAETTVEVVEALVLNCAVLMTGMVSSIWVVWPPETGTSLTTPALVCATVPLLIWVRSTAVIASW